MGLHGFVERLAGVAHHIVGCSHQARCIARLPVGLGVPAASGPGAHPACWQALHARHERAGFGHTAVGKEPCHPRRIQAAGDQA